MPEKIKNIRKIQPFWIGYDFIINTTEDLLSLTKKIAWLYMKTHQCGYLYETGFIFFK